MCQTMTERIAGCLYGAAYGDSLGAPTENRTREQIFAKWGYVDKLLDPPMDVFARGNRAGQVTDDFSMAYTAIQTILHADGRVNDTVSKEALLAWGSDERMLTQFAGPTSQRFIRQLQGIEPTGETRFEPVNVNRCASNGGAMKIGPVACFAKEHMEDALELARIICFPTHGNAQAMSAAAAVAAAVSTALGGASLTDILEAAVTGAAWGEQVGRTGATTAGPSVVKRLRFAISLGLDAETLSDAMDTLRAYFDCSGMAADSVPVSFGLMAASGGQLVPAVAAAANIGNDTDTIATIIGAVLGAHQGVAVLLEEVLQTIDEANGYDLRGLAHQIYQTEVKLESGDVK